MPLSSQVIVTREDTPKFHLSADLIPTALDCGLTIAFDQYTVDPLMSATIWSWQVGYPEVLLDTHEQQQQYAILHSTTGRWTHTDCSDGSQQYFSMCVSIEDRTFWSMSQTATTAATPTAIDILCPEGYVFGAPRTAHENRLAWAVLTTAGQQQVITYTCVYT